MKKKLCLLAMVLFFGQNLFSQNGWVQLADYPGSGSVNIAGTSDNKDGLAGMGWYSSASSNYKDWWQYNSTDNLWVAKTSLTGSVRYAHSAFRIGDTAYVCFGSDYSNFYKDLWKYNSGTNSWVQKADFPGTTRYGAVAQGTTTKAYVGLGEHDSGGGLSDYFADFYEYDRATDAWSVKASLPGQPRFCAFSFMIDNVIYVVGGRTETAGAVWVYLKDMWAYDIAGNSWTQKTSYPGDGSQAMGGFALGQYAYVGLGYTGTIACSDFWKYNPQTDSWIQLPDFPGGDRYGMMNFNIGTTGYLGCGRSASTSTCMKDFWKYVDPSAGLPESNIDEKIKIYPVPSNSRVFIEGAGISKVEIYTANGLLVKGKSFSKLSVKSSIDISEMASGFYYAKIFSGKDIITKKIIKN